MGDTGSIDTMLQGAAPPRRVIAVYALCSTWPERIAGALTREATEALAEALARFPTLLTRSHHLFGSSLSPEEGLDSTLREEDPEGWDAQTRFVLMSSQPAGQLLRDLTLEQGCTLALTGRMDPGREEVGLSLNLWEVTGPTLYYCYTGPIARDAFPEGLAQIAADIAWRLEAAPDLEQAQRLTLQALGTDQASAWEAYASARDRLRQADEDAPESLHVAVIRALCQALALDPGYDAARHLLQEQATDRLRRQDLASAEALLRGLEDLPDDRLLYDLLMMEAMGCLGQTQQALDLVQDLAQRYPGDLRLETWQARAKSFT